MHTKLIKFVQMLALSICLAVPATGWSRTVEETPSAMAMTGDAIFVRPVMLAGTILGAGVFLISSPFSALGGNLGEAWDVLVQGPFETTYPIALQQGKLFDLIFIDGNHRGDALAQYVKEAMPFLSEKGIIVCDDIHWSADMEAAWHVLCDEPHWTLRADFQEWGLLTQNPDLKREFQALRF